MARYHLLSLPSSNRTQIASDSVRLGFLLSLPCRYRVGGLYRFHRPEECFEICLQNRTTFAANARATDFLFDRYAKTGSLDLKPLWTDILILIDHPQLTSGDLDGLRAGDLPKVNFLPHLLAAGQHLNEFTVAYLSLSRDWGDSHTPRLTRRADVLYGVTWYVAILGPADEPLSEAHVRALLQLENVDQGQRACCGDLSDLAAADLHALHDAFRRQQQHVFYEFLVSAQAALAADDLVGALLLACAALEGAHAAFLHHAMAAILPASGADNEELVNNLLREQGFHTLFRVTVQLFMRPHERPAQEVIDRCKKAIEMRNDIMHAKIRKGKYKARQYGPKELIEAHHSLVKMYRHFEAALQARQPET